MLTTHTSSVSDHITIRYTKREFLELLKYHGIEEAQADSITDTFKSTSEWQQSQRSADLYLITCFVTLAIFIHAIDFFG